MSNIKRVERKWNIVEVDVLGGLLNPKTLPTYSERKSVYEWLLEHNITIVERWLVR